MNALEVVGYIVAALVAWRMWAGHLAYSLTMTAAGRKRWRDHPCFPLERQDGSQPPAWYGAAWRGFFLAIVWPAAPLLIILLWACQKAPAGTFSLAVGAERSHMRRERERQQDERIADLERELEIR